GDGGLERQPERPRQVHVQGGRRDGTGRGDERRLQEEATVVAGRLLNRSENREAGAVHHRRANGKVTYVQLSGGVFCRSLGWSVYVDNAGLVEFALNGKPGKVTKFEEEGNRGGLQSESCRTPDDTEEPGISLSQPQ